MVGPEGCPKAVFALALRALRNSIGAPTYRELARKAPVSDTALSRAADGSRQPTWPVAKAYVEACCGNVKEFERLYLSLFGSLR